MSHPEKRMSVIWTDRTGEKYNRWPRLQLLVDNQVRRASQTFFLVAMHLNVVPLCRTYLLCFDPMMFTLFSQVGPVFDTSRSLTCTTHLSISANSYFGQLLRFSGVGSFRGRTWSDAKRQSPSPIFARGYMGAAQRAIRNVPVRVVVTVAGGDSKERNQSAIGYVRGLPRMSTALDGAVLLYSDRDTPPR